VCVFVCLRVCVCVCVCVCLCVAKEIEAAGGKALPCVVDIRHEADLEKAVLSAVECFGGIDIVINNASAISLTGTESTPIKRFDLMNQVNARGTYLTTKTCLPYLQKASNPHILTISPPLNMNKRWFKNHVAYTIAKYGMSMCTLGWAEEFKEQQIAANALWPRTAIATAYVFSSSSRLISTFFSFSSAALCVLVLL
jgi:citronellol/citronellal dehydrogenase